MYSCTLALTACRMVEGQLEGLLVVSKTLVQVNISPVCRRTPERSHPHDSAGSELSAAAEQVSAKHRQPGLRSHLRARQAASGRPPSAWAEAGAGACPSPFHCMRGQSCSLRQPAHYTALHAPAGWCCVIMLVWGSASCSLRWLAHGSRDAADSSMAAPERQGTDKACTAGASSSGAPGSATRVLRHGVWGAQSC